MACSRILIHRSIHRDVTAADVEMFVSPWTARVYQLTGPEAHPPAAEAQPDTAARVLITTPTHVSGD
ncbi:hypothetical protein [Amycolatopsis sp. GM8]|uniref:hypothetical protein n=1 Tax=Amycolatopsis sp. GM8 TaxID=2896530 RepID=UPI001F1707C7|nr:hypothetical protein [Amycolatopsis sp. GM8]